MELVRFSSTVVNHSMDTIKQSFSVSFEYPVYFTSTIFSPDNSAFRDFLHSQKSSTTKKLLVVIDDGVAAAHPPLQSLIKAYFEEDPFFELVDSMLIVPGGEGVKNSDSYYYKIIEAVNTYGIDRHSYIVAIGGGSVLDMVGFAAAVSHRGIRHIRIPTTVLSQNDSGVGVKNGINYFGKKNFLGSFAPPAAVFNDAHFLTTLPDAEWRAGISEAIKVALIKNAPFFAWLEEAASALAHRNSDAMSYLIKRCAQLHIEHIAGGDPFEMGSSRPLDFGHWSAHKIEQLSNFTIRHGEAVAMGIALDSAYSYVSGRISEQAVTRIINVLQAVGFELHHPLMAINDEDSPVIKGLHEFREHLGGELTIMLLKAIGQGEEVHHLDLSLLQQASNWLRTYTK